MRTEYNIEEKFHAQIEQNPNLSYDGWRHYDRYFSESDFIESRNDLRTQKSFYQFLLCREWLSRCERSKTINKRLNSYGLKSIVQSAADAYVSNGTLILAAISIGFVFRRSNSRNCWFNILIPPVKEVGI